MYLKSIEVQGFKSFANKIKFEFHNGITGIVGPNGSGKSNVADAVRWVLGEQRIKQLRGGRMEDVIFAGTENRKPLGYAHVAITLDNTDHKLSVEYSEVTVSRRLFRSGESEYRINGAVCRLKDIHELFYDTGIGKEVLVVQAGKAGRKLGKIEINLDSLGLGGKPKYELINIDSRYDGYNDPALSSAIGKYSAGVDSLMHLWVGTTDKKLDADNMELLNFFSDYIYDRGKELTGKADLAIANKGGLRDGLPKGKFSKGHIINMVPFRNYITVIDVKGSDLREVFDVMAKTDGNGVSHNVEAVYDTIGGRPQYHATSVLIDGKAIDDSKTYRVATIDYLANGGDYMKGLARGVKVAVSPNAVFDDLLYYFTEGKGKDMPLEGSPESRWSIRKH